MIEHDTAAVNDLQELNLNYFNV